MCVYVSTFRNLATSFTPFQLSFGRDTSISFGPLYPFLNAKGSKRSHGVNVSLVVMDSLSIKDTFDKAWGSLHEEEQLPYKQKVKLWVCMQPACSDGLIENLSTTLSLNLKLCNMQDGNVIIVNNMVQCNNCTCFLTLSACNNCVSLTRPFAALPLGVSLGCAGVLSSKHQSAKCPTHHE